MTRPSPTKFALESADGHWATYDTRQGAYLTGNKHLRYVWDEAARAEKQRPLYENALGVGLTVKLVN